MTPARDHVSQGAPLHPEEPASMVALLAVAAGLALFFPALSGRVLGGHLSGSVPGALQEARATRALGDIEMALLPFLCHASRELRAGRIGLWNPYAGAGVPFLANEQSAMLHPFTLLSALVPWRASLLVVAMLRWLLAFGGTFVLARNVGCGRIGATVAAASFSLSGAVVVWLSYPVGAVFTHVPLLLAVALHPRRRASLAIVLALSAFAGHFEYLPILWALASCAVVASRASRRERICRLLLVLALGVGLSAPMILPGAEYLAQSRGFGQLAMSAGVGAVSLLRDPRHLLALVDGAYGSRAEGMIARGLDPMSLVMAYLGPLTLVLAASAARSPVVRRLWCLVAIAVAAIASHPVSRLVWRLPVLKMMHAGRLLVLPVLAVSLLAGLGADGLLRERRIGQALVALAALAAPIPISRMLGPRALPVAIGWYLACAAALVAVAALRSRAAPIVVLALVAERGASLARFNPWTRPADLFPETPVVAALRGSLGPLDRFVAAGELLAPDVATVYALPDARVYDAISPAAIVSAMVAEGNRSQFGRLGALPSPLSRALGARIVAEPRRAPPRAPSIEGGTDGIVVSEGSCVQQVLRTETGYLGAVRVGAVVPPGSGGLRAQIRLGRPFGPLLWEGALESGDDASWLTATIEPPAWIAATRPVYLQIDRRDDAVVDAPVALVATSGEGPLFVDGRRRPGALLVDPSYERERLKIVADVDGIVLRRDDAAVPRFGLADPRGSLTIVAETPTHVELQVTPAAATRLLVSTKWYAGWTAVVNARGEERATPLGEEGVALEAGRSRVRLVYAPASFRVGLFTGLLAALAVAGVAVSADGGRNPRAPRFVD